MGKTRWIALAAAFALLSACAANDQNLTRAQGAGFGAVLGAGVGALVGKDARGALVGAAVGGLAGLTLGEAVARKKESYVSTEAMIQEERSIARQKASEMAAYNASLEDHLQTLNRDIADLEARVASGRRDHGAALELRADAEDSLDDARRRLAETEKQVELSRHLYADAEGEGSADLADWDRQIEDLERRRDELAALIAQFEASSRRIS